MEKEEANNNNNNKVDKKKSQIIVIFYLMVLVLLIGLGAIGTIVISNKSDYELQRVNANILYLGEEVEREEEEVLNVELGDKEENVKFNTSEVPNEEPKNNENNNVLKKQDTNEAPYCIRVNYKANVTTVYKKDSSGNHTVPVRAMICSCRYCYSYRWYIFNFRQVHVEVIRTVMFMDNMQAELRVQYYFIQCHIKNKTNLLWNGGNMINLEKMHHLVV